jgi:hypothetical protein
MSFTFVLCFWTDLYINCKAWYLGNVCPFQLLSCVSSQLPFCCSNESFCFLFSPGLYFSNRLAFVWLILMHVSVLKGKFWLGIISGNLYVFCNLCPVCFQCGMIALLKTGFIMCNCSGVKWKPWKCYKIKTLMCAAARTVSHRHGFKAHRSAMCCRSETVLKNYEALLKQLPLN